MAYSYGAPSAKPLAGELAGECAPEKKKWRTVELPLYCGGAEAFRSLSKQLYSRTVASARQFAVWPSFRAMPFTAQFRWRKLLERHSEPH